MELAFRIKLQSFNLDLVTPEIQAMELALLYQFQGGRIA